MSVNPNENPKIGAEEEEILSFIAKKGLARWTDLTTEFEEKKKKTWHHSKFVRHWNNIKEYLEKVPNKKTGRSEYRIKSEKRIIGDKALLRTQIDNGILSSVEISSERFGKVANQLAEASLGSLDLWKDIFEKAEKGFKAAKEKNMQEGLEEPNNIYEVVEKRHPQPIENNNDGFLQKIKKTISPEKIEDQQKKKVVWSSFHLATVPAMAIIKKEKLKRQLIEVFKMVKIQVVTSSGETAPVLIDEDIINLLTIVIPKITDENKGKPREKPFQLIVSFPDFRAD